MDFYIFNNAYEEDGRRNMVRIPIGYDHTSRSNLPQFGICAI